METEMTLETLRIEFQELIEDVQTIANEVDELQRAHESRRGPEGLRGEKGAPGAAGRDGKDGVSNIPGPQGPAGKDGAAGPRGERGADSTAPGPAGRDGIDGKDGISSVPGPRGEKGDSIRGERGTAATIQIGTVTVGDHPSVTNGGDSHNAVLNFVFPKPIAGRDGKNGLDGDSIEGERGEDGPSPDIKEIIAHADFQALLISVESRMRKIWKNDMAAILRADKE